MLYNYFTTNLTGLQDLKDKNVDTENIALTRMGDFYEAFGDKTI